MKKDRAERLLVLVLTRRCNQRCGFCPQTFMDRDMEESILDAALTGLLPLLRTPSRVKLFGGEPLLRPDLVTRAVEFLAAKSPRTVIELPTNGRGLPAVAALLARRPKVEVFVSTPSAKSARHPGAVHNFLLPPGEAAAKTARRLIEARRMGFARFNFLPAYFVPWTPAQLEGLTAAFAALQVVLRKMAAAGRAAEVVNLARHGSTPLYNDGLVVDADGEVYSSNLVLADAVWPHRKRLSLGHVRRPRALAARARSETAQVLKDSFSDEIMASSLAADAALTAFCRAIS